MSSRALYNTRDDSKYRSYHMESTVRTADAADGSHLFRARRSSDSSSRLSESVALPPALKLLFHSVSKELVHFPRSTRAVIVRASGLSTVEYAQTRRL